MDRSRTGHAAGAKADQSLVPEDLCMDCGELCQVAVRDDWKVARGCCGAWH